MRVLEVAPVADEAALLAVGLGGDGAVVGLPVRAEDEQADDGEGSPVERVQHVPLAWPDRHSTRTYELRRLTSRRFGVAQRLVWGHGTGARDPHRHGGRGVRHEGHQRPPQSVPVVVEQRHVGGLVRRQRALIALSSSARMTGRRCRAERAGNAGRRRLRSRAHGACRPPSSPTFSPHFCRNVAVRADRRASRRVED